MFYKSHSNTRLINHSKKQKTNKQKKHFTTTKIKTSHLKSTNTYMTLLTHLLLLFFLDNRCQISNISGS